MLIQPIRRIWNLIKQAADILSSFSYPLYTKGEAASLEYNIKQGRKRLIVAYLFENYKCKQSRV